MKGWWASNCYSIHISHSWKRKANSLWWRLWTVVELWLSQLRSHNQFQVFVTQINTDFGLKYKATILDISPVLSGRKTITTYINEKSDTIHSLLFSGPAFKASIDWRKDAPRCMCRGQTLAGAKSLLYQVSSGNTTQVRNLGVKCVCMLCHLNSLLKDTWSFLLSVLIYSSGSHLYEHCPNIMWGLARWLSG